MTMTTMIDGKCVAAEALPTQSQQNTRVLAVQSTNLPNCIEVHKFPLAMARQLIGQQF